MERNEYRENVKKAIDEIFDQIEALKVKADNASEKVRQEYQEKIKELELLRNQMEAKLDELANTADSKWDKMKEVLDSSLQSFKEGFKKLGKLFD